ncbi:hypothetical protein BDK61_1461 [Haloarcula quadrata]|uniref:Uncharacterized protein n=1 Tax=Haloarcula quadrata TaxID=182779 RepID=A0A495R4H2_9EURY|nr:hypothetical protein [Haloarcula quadrata]RKS82162.1 hypothetical protein BDK61_1461 [Haloarcula quadrata]
MQREADLPPRDETDGRGEGAGSWLEEQTVEALQDWDWDAARGGVIWGFRG